MYPRYQFGYSATPGLCELELKIPIGGTGAVGTIVGSQVSSVTRLAQGIYRIKFLDKYQKFIHGTCSIESPAGSTQSPGALVTGTMYQILTVGNTDWSAVGLPSDLTAAVGMCFVATGAGSGTGTSKVVTNSGVSDIEWMPSPDSELSPSGTGSYLIFQTLGPTNSSTTTPIPVDPTSGSVLRLRMLFSNSTVSPSY